MSFDYSYQHAMNRLAELSQPHQPAYVRLQALTTLVRELSPSNARHQQVLSALKPEPPSNPALPEATLTPEQRTDFHLHPVPADLAANPSAPTDTPDPEDDGNAEEEDDPW